MDMDTDLTDQLISLFKQAGVEHHQAYVESNGEDADWPMWYANYLLVDLGKLLGAAFTRSELIYLLVLASKMQAMDAPGSDPARYFSQFFLDRYG